MLLEAAALISEEQINEVAAKMQHDGFVFSRNDVKDMLRGTVMLGRPIVKSIAVTSGDEPSECDICSKAHEEEDHESQLDDPTIN